MFKNTILTVSQVNSYIKLMFEGDRNLSNIFICGEISNLRTNYSSGHVYFSLKEDETIIKAIMFSNNFRRLNVDLEDGIEVIVRGSVSSYEKSGQYQIYVDDLQLYGSGAHYDDIEKIKEKLEKEGLFDGDRKRRLPQYPSKIGIITSPSGAVIRDIESVINRRYPVCKIEVFPVQVQGINAKDKIISALKYFGEVSDKVDIIIIARGGGSAEDLSAFNDEFVAREVALSPVPIISAIGHDNDWTICDFVADMRASTPSVAAEIAVPDKDQILSLLFQFGQRMNYVIKGIIREQKIDIEDKSRYLYNIFSKVVMEYKVNSIRIFENKLLYSIEKFLTKYKLIFNRLDSRLNGVNPLNVLMRGYTVASSRGKKILSAIDVEENCEMELSFIDGKVKFIVKSLRR